MHFEDVVILCGGRGTRLQEHSLSIPKPLVEIGDRPILWHVIQIYAGQGFARVVLCTGYKGEPLEALAKERQLHAYRHTGFWECMDTYKDAVQLNDLWQMEQPPWKVWA